MKNKAKTIYLPEAFILSLTGTLTMPNTGSLRNKAMWINEIIQIFT